MFSLPRVEKIWVRGWGRYLSHQKINFDLGYKFKLQIIPRARAGADNYASQVQFLRWFLLCLCQLMNVKLLLRKTDGYDVSTRRHCMLDGKFKEPIESDSSESVTSTEG